MSHASSCTYDDVEVATVANGVSVAIPAYYRQRLGGLASLTHQQKRLGLDRLRAGTVLRIPLFAVEAHLVSFQVPRIVCGSVKPGQLHACVDVQNVLHENPINGRPPPNTHTQTHKHAHRGSFVSSFRLDFFGEFLFLKLS